MNVGDTGIDINAVVAVILAVGGGLAAQHSKTVKAENQALRDANLALSEEIDLLRQQHKEDVRRIEGVHVEIWMELKYQREALSQNRETTIKLISSIERLNEILDKLEIGLNDRVTRNECTLLRHDSDVCPMRRDAKEKAA
jgi:hypothetical protein